MLSSDTKKRFLEELAKDGIVASACRKSGLSRMTFYRWEKSDPSFRKRVKEAMRIGRANGNDLADFSLLQLLREKNLGAIKWYQAHNSPHYRPKPRRVVMEHTRTHEGKDEFERWRKEQLDEITNLFQDAGKLVAELPYDEGEKLTNLPPSTNHPENEDTSKE